MKISREFYGIPLNSPTEFDLQDEVEVVIRGKVVGLRAKEEPGDNDLSEQESAKYPTAEVLANSVEVRRLKRNEFEDLAESEK